MLCMNPVDCTAAQKPGLTANRIDPGGYRGRAGRICARDLVVGNILRVNDWTLHIIRIERERGVAVLTAEFQFLMHFALDDVVTIQLRAAA